MNPVFDSITDGLAEHGFAISNQFLSQSEVDAILQSGEFATVDTFRKAGIGKDSDLQINEAVRGDHIHWLDKNGISDPIKTYTDRLTALITYLNRALFLSMKDYEVHLTVYPTGTFYKRHLDQFKKDDHRKLSVICYLNNEWREEHGGQLRMYLPDGSIDVFPLAGRLVCFRSDQIEHEVLPATRERRSITGWILDQVAELRHL